MIIYKEEAALKNKLAENRKQKKTVGFVPTMGALHEGHIALIKTSLQKCDVTICSIFVNPTQFNDPKDFEKYPENISNDILLLESTGCDILFLPAVSEIYPAGTQQAEHYDVGDMEFILEGKYRPGHFQGVCQVVNKLLKIMNPDSLFLGQKDYQQCVVIKRLVALEHPNTKVEVIDTVREKSGLAMSSRNLRLSEEQKRNAANIFAMLTYIKRNFSSTSFSRLEKYATDYLLNHGFHKVDYVAIANADTLQTVTTAQEASKLVVLVAAYTGEVRLIDNMVITE